MVTLLWIIVGCGTFRGLIVGDLLSAPCLKDLEGKKDVDEKQLNDKNA